MEELLSVLIDIKNELFEMNLKLDEIKGSGLFNSITDMCDKLDAISEGYSLKDVKVSVDVLQSSVDDVYSIINNN